MNTKKWDDNKHLHTNMTIGGRNKETTRKHIMLHVQNRNALDFGALRTQQEPLYNQKIQH